MVRVLPVLTLLLLAGASGRAPRNHRAPGVACAAQREPRAAARSHPRFDRP